MQDSIRVIKGHSKIVAIIRRLIFYAIISFGYLILAAYTLNAFEKLALYKENKIILWVVENGIVPWAFVIFYILILVPRFIYKIIQIIGANLDYIIDFDNETFEYPGKPPKRHNISLRDIEKISVDQYTKKNKDSDGKVSRTTYYLLNIIGSFGSIQITRPSKLSRDELRSALSVAIKRMNKQQ